MKKIYKILLIVLAVLIVVVLGRRHRRVARGEKLHRKTRPRAAGPLDPHGAPAHEHLHGRLRVEGLKIGAAGDSTTFFALDSFDMRMRILPLLSNRVVVKHITFAGLNVKVYQRGSAFSFDDIIDHFASDTTAVAEPAKPSEPWEIGIYNIAVRDSRLFYKIWSSMRYGVSTTSTCRFRAFISGVKRPTWAPC